MLGEPYQLAVARIQAREDRQQLVDRRERARELRQVEQPQLADAVAERVERVQRAAIRRPEGDQRARVLEAAEHLDVVAADQPAHRVRDEDDLRVRVRLPAPREPALGLALEPPRGDAVVAPPVVGELEVARPRLEPQRPLEPLRDLRVAVDLPEAGEQVHVADDARRDHAVAEVVDVGRVVPELEVLKAAAGAEEAVQHRARRRTPHLLAVALEHAAGDAGDEDDDVGAVGHQRQE